MYAVEALVVEAVLERSARCGDASFARAALVDALVTARGPARPRAPAVAPTNAHWTLTMTVVPEVPIRAPEQLVVEARIYDEVGDVVASRRLGDRDARVCLPVARGVAAWAALVLDAEMSRARERETDAVTASASLAPSLPVRPSAQVGVGERATEGVDDHETSENVASREMTVGAMAYFRSGMTATGGVVGAAPFLTFEVARAWIARPGLFFGQLIGAAQTADVHVGARVDVCRRLPGNYVERRGIEADVCAGVEGGVVAANVASAGVALGPSLNLRGELTSSLALELRGLVGAYVLPYASQAAPVFASVEIGVSVRLR